MKVKNHQQTSEKPNHTWERHEDVTVLSRNHLEPGLPRHDVVSGLQEALPKQLIWEGEEVRGRQAAKKSASK